MSVFLSWNFCHEIAGNFSEGFLTIGFLCIQAFNFPDHTGYPIGAGLMPTMIRLETHFDNPSSKVGTVPNSDTVATSEDADVTIVACNFTDGHNWL